MPATAETIPLEVARRVVAAAEAKATEIGQPMDIAVVDAGGNLKTHVRMDGAFVGSIEISIDKAWTSIAFQTDTKTFAEDAIVGGAIEGINTTNHGRIVIFAGGLPLVRDDVIIGAIGVSTGTVEQDQQVAEAGAAAL